MKKYISLPKLALALLALSLFGLSACKGRHESQGQKVGKKIDNFENNVKNKGHELHERSKEKAHELIEKS